MAFIRCTACGAKALVASTQCPKCSHPFNMKDARGNRVALRRCRSCGIMHRIDASCHWCGDVPSGITWPTVSTSVLRRAAAVALMFTAVGGAWRYAPKMRDLAGADGGGGYGVGRATGALTIGDTRNTDGDASPVPEVSAAPSGVDTSAARVDNSITWVPAVARTWVNVRSNAGRAGEVVGVIKPATRAMLGTDRAGWRQVSAPGVSGWVDPRLFEADSLRKSGE